MSSSAGSRDALLMLKLDETWQSDRMRAAWDWFAADFLPCSASEIKAVMDPAHPHSADFRAVTSYWEMAASFVVRGALNAQMLESASELRLVWIRVMESIEQVRGEMAWPGFLANVERIATAAPVELERARTLDEAGQRRRAAKDAREYLANGWACSESVQETILRDYLYVCLRGQAGVASVCNLEFAARHVVEKKLRGAFVECGTWRGASLTFWARSFLRNGGDDSAAHIYGFDSFEGMPRMTQEDGERASQWLYGKRLSDVESPLTDGSLVSTGANLASEAECLAFVESTGYNKDSIHVIKGWFQDTLPKHKRRIGPIAVLRLDADFYEATKFCLETLYDRVLSHGLVILDDYEYFDGCRQAADEFIASHEPGANLIYYGDFGRCFFKP